MASSHLIAVHTSGGRAAFEAKEAPFQVCVARFKLNVD